MAEDVKKNSQAIWTPSGLNKPSILKRQEVVRSGKDGVFEDYPLRKTQYGW